MTTRVVNINREACDEYCGRGTPWGNKYIIGRHGTRRGVIAKHRRDVLADEAFKERIRRELTGKRLGCHCAPLPCHCDVYVEVCDA